MFFKQSALVLVFVISLQLVTGATVEEALQALQEIYYLSLALMGNINTASSGQWELLHDQLDTEIKLAKQEIDDQVQHIIGRILEMTANAQAAYVNVDRCVSTAQEDVQNFAADLADRLEECYGNMIIAGNAILDSTSSKVIYQYTASVYCGNSSFIQCRDHQDADTCFDTVISRIAILRAKMVNSFNVIRAETLNQLPGRKYPCRQIIVQELALYPTLILNYVSSCVARASARAVQEFSRGC